MFALINQGQLYTDSSGYPIKIIRCINSTVLYRRMDGLTQSVKINDFNELFERIDHQEYRQILAETEQEAHLKKLRAMKRK
ncbi:TPA: DUF4222 domain-containing protein [Escherichia coli]|uniref:DUF4222 domain-containing protein n=1 Tax=Escherichia coli TaxID=562 RepID=UPI000BE38931|nr:DUF4222 domain-containing protein [Escherichia coli]EFN8407986.1 DUF4222 domain-containing protein [Escherichia coli O15]EEU9456730.1 DUF4222 domain-containing protein [Escherichia coli]EEW2339421.1 DUF4222 domain-containing protein [Escherichia coli]EFL4153176.1 DUF4222 domain-containing protein [Escherichia coli]EFL9443164.1 DUF4222 domain-containing protein [Escherichia coli]